MTSRQFVVFATAVIAFGAFVFGVQVGMKRGRETQYADDLKRFADIAEIQRLNYRHLEGIYQILLCESGFDNAAIGDGGSARGVAQFHETTFNEMRAQAGMPDLEYMNGNDQIKLLDWALRNGKGRLWTCYRKLWGKNEQ